ncbi:acyl-CoA dehydrogenase family protein [Microbulbifer sp. 2205BS26-8]|uniref:acyl-CoA dehydrogenase family protein n=1 Tax=Microbulbifer sp. 2205BS26-8 TaxID=3064386 RepID=UPI00273E6F5F|nr:acyl-CoA dehydrogenase family protein [Microbulbifer sp. 2205BS26-8]MDP5209556.1 acyl-CoA dehydrogenase family protein [Microbulbifer sp. 2205BS26-8]
MKLGFTAEDEVFRHEIADWLADNLSGEFESIRFRGGPGDEHMLFLERVTWEKKLAEGGWTGIGWPREFGGRGCSLEQQVIFYEEYARAGGPGRAGHIGEGLVAPTLMAFGSKQQQQRFLPKILGGEEFWCQGYSEPGAGSDLSNISTRAEFDPIAQVWRLNGQKIWTSLAQVSDWCFVIARTEPGSKGHNGLGFFLVEMDQAGIDVRPIQQLTGTSEFNEVFFENALVATDCIVGQPGDGWRVAMGLLGFERGISTLGQQMLFQNELQAIVRLARHNGASKDPSIRQRIADAHMGLKIMRYNAMRTLSSEPTRAGLDCASMTYKLYWSTWHRNLGNLAVDVLGPDANVVERGSYGLSRLQTLFLFTRSDTIYGGTNQIQRNIIAERALGLPKEPRPAV